MDCSIILSVCFCYFFLFVRFVASILKLVFIFHTHVWTLWNRQMPKGPFVKCKMFGKNKNKTEKIRIWPNRSLTFISSNSIGSIWFLTLTNSPASGCQCIVFTFRFVILLISTLTILNGEQYDTSQIHGICWILNNMKNITNKLQLQPLYCDRFNTFNGCMAFSRFWTQNDLTDSDFRGIMNKLNARKIKALKEGTE